MTNKFAVFVLLVSGIPLIVGGCGHKQQISTPARTTAETPAANATVQGPAQAPNADQPPTAVNTTADNPTPDAAAQTPGAPLDSSIATASAPPNDSANTSDPTSGDAPIVNVGLTIDQAYAALPHERMVWVASDSTAPSSEQPYLGAIFRVLDEAIAVKVAGLQHYSRGDFDSLDIDAQYAALLNYARATSVPSALSTYHQDVLTALSNERLFFQNWNADRTNPTFTTQFQANAQVQAASTASRSAYFELIRVYPNEPPANKQAFYDYHCALDFL